METVYRLRDDSESIRSMQSGSLDESKWAGLRNTHGLVASSAWWSAIESGALTLHAIDGVISGFWSGQGGGGPAEFQLQQLSGEKTMWLCGIDPMLAKRLFQIGRKATVQYVCQQLKNPFEGRHETKLTISISLV